MEKGWRIHDVHMRSCVHLGECVRGDILFACWSWLCQLCLFCSAEGPELSGIRVNPYVVAAAAAPNPDAAVFIFRRDFFFGFLAPPPTLTAPSGFRAEFWGGIMNHQGAVP